MQWIACCVYTPEEISLYLTPIPASTRRPSGTDGPDGPITSLRPRLFIGNETKREEEE